MKSKWDDIKHFNHVWYNKFTVNIKPLKLVSSETDCDEGSIKDENEFKATN
jgi:hypothetical protein